MSDDAPTRHPLSWPAGRPRKLDRRYGRPFRQDGAWIGVVAAVRRLNVELERLGAVYPLLSTDLQIRLDGSLILNRGMPADPGAVAWFQLQGKPIALACDTFDDLAQNIAALAAHVEATRAIERYGVASAAETLQAFAALPAPDAVARKRPWWKVFNLTSEGALDHVPASYRPGIINDIFRDLARDAHPDRGGTAERMAELNAARDEALAIHGQKAIAS